MSRALASFVVAAVTTLGISIASPQTAAVPTGQTAKSVNSDSTSLTYFSLSQDSKDPNKQVVNWTTCKEQASTCPSGTLQGPFGSVGYVMEGNAVRDKKGARDIYVLDTAAGEDKAGVVLNVYQQTESGAIQKNPKTRLGLPLVGGPQATVSMATNNRYIFVTSDQSENVVLVDKRKNYQASEQPTNFLGLAFTGMTVNERGFVEVMQGGGTTGFPPNFTVFDTNGNAVLTGSAQTFLINNKTPTQPPKPQH